MAYTQSDLDQIDAAISSGALTVTHNGRTVTYRSVTELRRARAIVQEALAAQSGQAPGGLYTVTFTTLRGD